MEITMDDSGRVAIPDELRAQVGFKPGMKLDVTTADGGVVVKPVITPQRPELIPAGTGLVWKDGVLVFMCEFEDPNFDLLTFIEKTRNERDYDVSGGLLK